MTFFIQIYDNQNKKFLGRFFNFSIQAEQSLKLKFNFVENDFHCFLNHHFD